MRSEACDVVSDTDAARLSEAYDDFLRRRMAGTGRLSDLERRLLRALSWYRRARWQPDPTRKVLEHWIALEQFLADPNSGKGSAATRAAELSMTWRALPELHQLRSLAERAKGYIRKDTALLAAVSAVVRLERWKDYEYVLLERGAARTLVDALGTAGDQPVFQLLRRESETAWSQEATITNSVRAERWSVRLRLEQAYKQRNEIVHEAQSPGLAVASLADQIERIVEDCLMKAVGYVLEVDGTDHTVDALLEWWSRPWPASW